MVERGLKIMRRIGKELHLERLRELFSGATFVVVVRCVSMKASDSVGLRRAVDSAGGRFVIVKNTIAGMVASCDSRYSCLAGTFVGSTGVIFVRGRDDIIEVAKVLVHLLGVLNDAGASGGKLSLVCGVYDGDLVRVDDILAFAKLVSLDSVRVCLLHVLSNGVQLQLCRALLSSSSRVVRVLDACVSSKG